MEKEIKDRTDRLARLAKVSDIEVKSMNLQIGESKEFKMIDIQAYQSIRTRFNRAKNRDGFRFTTAMKGNTLTVTRIENEA